MTHKSGPQRGQRAATNKRSEALRGYKPKSKKSPTGSNAIATTASS